MSFLKVHDNWPEWMVKWLERKVKENGGRYTLTIESSPKDTYDIVIDALGSALAAKQDEEILRALKDGENED